MTIYNDHDKNNSSKLKITGGAFLNIVLILK